MTMPTPWVGRMTAFGVEVGCSSGFSGVPISGVVVPAMGLTSKTTSVGAGAFNVMKVGVTFWVGGGVGVDGVDVGSACKMIGVSNRVNSSGDRVRVGDTGGGGEIVGVKVGLGSSVAVSVGSGVKVGGDVLVGSGSGVGDGSGVSVGATVGGGVSVGVSDGVGVMLGVSDGVNVSDGVLVGVAVGVGVSDGGLVLVSDGIKV